MSRSGLHSAMQLLRLKPYMLLTLLVVAFTACTHFDEYDNSPAGNFEALWTILDQNYCFFESKGIDWDQVHREYASRISPTMNQEALFYLLSDMLKELKDGHVNLVAPFEVGRYDAWYYDSVPNFDYDIVDKLYLGRDYSQASGLKYKLLSDNIGYIYYGSFSSSIGEGNLDYVIKRFEACHGIIIDIRDNGGGSLLNVEVLAARFTNEKVLSGYIQHKTGTGHSDFSEPYPRYLEPSKRLRFQKPVVVLTNRKCYSAANEFVNVMKDLPTVHIMGSTTGGGGGLPFTSELPNGWTVRFSASPILNSNKEHIEDGIAPHQYVYMDANPLSALTQDKVIETARTYINTIQGISSR